jgi:hypothetical protein
VTSFFPATQRAFIRQSELIRRLVETQGLSGPDGPIATRLSGWSVSTLVAHLVGGIETVWRWRGEAPVESRPIDEVGYWDLTAAAAGMASEWATTYAANRSEQELVEALGTAVERGVAEVGSAGGDEPIHLPLGDLWLPLDAFAQTRVIELTIHGFDLQAAYDLPYEADDTALTVTSVTLDRRLAGTRPDDLHDPIDWIQAAAGRTPHPDPRLPLLS